MSGALYVLHESASGYSLLEVVEHEEVGALLPAVQASVADAGRFGKLVKLKAFGPFPSAEVALENMNAVSESLAADHLIEFLTMNLPKAKKKKSGFALGVADAGLGSAIQEATGFPCRCDDTIRELLRGARTHMTKFIKELGDGAAEQAQLGLGHSYSRARVKFNPGRADNMVIQSIALLDQLDKDINTFAMRVREWCVLLPLLLAPAIAAVPPRCCDDSYRDRYP